MITISTEKGFVQVESWDEIVSRPGFLKDLDPEAHRLKEIIGVYIFPEKIPCGLSSCHTPHNRGYIVSTEAGNETNIGHVCGKKHFGQDFDTRTFDREVAAHENRELLRTFRFRLDALEAAVTKLRESRHGADWVRKFSTALVTPGRGCPDHIVQTVSDMVRAGSNVLSASRKATKEEIEDLEAAQGTRLPRPYFIQVPIGQLSGLEVLYPQNDLRAHLVVELQERMKAFRSLDIDQMAYKDLKEWATWAQSVDSRLDEARRLVNQGRRLLDQENLSVLFDLVQRPGEVAQLRSFVKAVSDE